MEMAASGKWHFLYLARVEMGVLTPGKRVFLGFARVEMGMATPGK